MSFPWGEAGPRVFSLGDNASRVWWQPARMAGRMAFLLLGSGSDLARPPEAGGRVRQPCVPMGGGVRFQFRRSGWEWSSVGLNRPPPHLFYCPLALELWTQSRRLSGDVAAAPCRSTALSPAFLRPCTHTFASCRRAHIRVTHSASIHCALGAAPGPALAEPPPSRRRKDAEH